MNKSYKPVERHYKKMPHELSDLMQGRSILQIAQEQMEMMRGSSDSATAVEIYSNATLLQWYVTHWSTNRDNWDRAVRTAINTAIKLTADWAVKYEPEPASYYCTCDKCGHFSVEIPDEKCDEPECDGTMQPAQVEESEFAS